MQSRRRIQERQRQRDELRRPLPNTLVLEGHVVVERAIETYHEHGCLGGPLVHAVPAFELALDDGTRHTVTLGNDPRIENVELLPPIPVSGPPVTGVGRSVSLRGRVRVAGVARHGDQVAPPEGRSAVLTVLR